MGRVDYCVPSEPVNRGDTAMARHRARGIVGSVIIIVLTLGLFGCSPTKLPLRAEVEPMKLRKMPMTAALVIPDSLKQTNSIHDVSCAGYYSVPIGLELENTLTSALSQIFDSVDSVTDKTHAAANYDVMVEVSDPKLEVEGHCLSRRFLYLTGPFYLFLEPTDRFEGQGSLHATVTDRNGQVLQNETFKSKPISKDTLFATSTDRTNS